MDPALTRTDFNAAASAAKRVASVAAVPMKAGAAAVAGVSRSLAGKAVVGGRLQGGG